MLKQMYAVRDDVACFYNNVWMAQNEAHAVRLMADALAKEPTSGMAQHPSDFILYQMGTFNDATGEINTVDCPRRICILSDLLKGTIEPDE